MIESFVETFVYTYKLFAKQYQSEFGRKRPYPYPKKPERWSRILERFPPLSDEEDTRHIDFALDGEVLPFEAVNLSHYRAPLSFWSDTVGPPKSGKTRSLINVSEVLKITEIPFIYFGEPPRVALPGMNDRIALNDIRTHNLLSRLRFYQSAIQDGGDLQKERNFYFTENGIFHSLIFTHMQAFLKKRPLIEQEMKTLIKPYIPMHNALIIAEVPWHISLFRGTKMPYNELISYHEGLSRLNKDLPELTDGNKEPLAIIRLNTTNRSPQEMGRFLLRSIGTILHGFDHE